jgi:hypothetical protein
MGTKKGRFWTKEAMPAEGMSLTDESETDKALRLLRVQREFLRSKHKVFGYTLDGKAFLMIRYVPADHPPGADTTPDVSA